MHRPGTDYLISFPQEQRKKSCNVAQPKFIVLNTTGLITLTDSAHHPTVIKSLSFIESLFIPTKKLSNS